ncbi:MAG: Hsp20/alpha crystallin family protein [Defluviicoccus sp.]|nr:MAG: Hsp20/alpha crystallin family protein [Defluviicoccus sp.]
MIRYSPGLEVWGEPLATLRRIQDEINRAFGDQRFTPSAEFPPINIWRSTDGVVVTAEIPGIALETVDLTVHQNTLTLKGRREPDVKEPDVSYHRRERTYGPFSRSIALPFAVDSEKVRASAQNGILTIELPRPETDKPRKIKINPV